MDRYKKEQALEVLNYWKLMDFLSQESMPKLSSSQRIETKKITNGENSSWASIPVFHSLNYFAFDIEKLIKKDAINYASFQTIASEIHVCIGTLKRNAIVDYLDKYFESKLDEQPEFAYLEKECISWFAFKTDLQGNYLNNSFQLSPILWAISEWEERRAHITHDFILDTTKYEEVISNFNNELQEGNFVQFIDKLYDKIYDSYIKGIFEGAQEKDIQPKSALIVYIRYKSEEEKSKDENPENYSDLGKSFFLNELEMLADKISKDEFGHNSRYEEKVLEYILTPFHKQSNLSSLDRECISPKESKEKMCDFFEKVLNVNKAPIAKWPSKFMPALMQQVAINLAIQNSNRMPVFSVNGPPGTGKTTLLKEIVANNIVERAFLLASNSDEPDDLFEKHSFGQGPVGKENSYSEYAPNYFSIKDDRINDFSMLVASSNNAAVENITKDLPKGSDILSGLRASNDDSPDIKEGLKEIFALFDYENPTDKDEYKQYKEIKTRNDIYFTQYANKLLKVDDCWGLVSVPLGKKGNIVPFCKKVLKSFVNDYGNEESRKTHKQKFKKLRQEFLEQYDHVKNLQSELKDICDLSKKVNSNKSSLSAVELHCRLLELIKQDKTLKERLEEERKELKRIEETTPTRFLFFRRKKISIKRIELVHEKEESIAHLKEEIKAVNQEKDIVNQEMAFLNDARSLQRMLENHSKGAKKLKPIDGDFMNQYVSSDEDEATLAQASNPWFTPEYNREREKLFLLACKLNKEFVVTSACMAQNMRNLLIAWNCFDGCDNRMSSKDKQNAMPYLLQSLFLITPVISTTFASIQNFLKDVRKPGAFGTLIIDEAGQAQPHMALGAMYRCRKAMVVGDPKQIEPVVKSDVDMFKKLLSSELLDAYKDKKLSVQGLADYINPYGTLLGEGDEKEWVGCPLTVHRRCIEPMYSISNELSYGGTMKQQTLPPSKEKEATFILNKSCWINVKGEEVSSKKNHFVENQGKVVLQLLEAKLKNDPSTIPNLFIITPFKSVELGIKGMIHKSELYKKQPRLGEWMNANRIGTVHTFQGQGTDEVIFLLGCDSKALGAVKWVNKNIVNVAVTRAKFRFYVIGDESVWKLNSSMKLAHEKIGEIIDDKELCNILQLEDVQDSYIDTSE